MKVEYLLPPDLNSKVIFSLTYFVSVYCQRLGGLWRANDKWLANFIGNVLLIYVGIYEGVFILLT